MEIIVLVSVCREVGKSSMKKKLGLCKQINTLRGFGEDEYVENGKIALLIG